MDIGLEKGRIDRNNPQMGTLGALIYPFLAPESLETTEHLQFVTKKDLNPLLPESMSQNLAMATSMLYLTGKTIGAPILLHFLKPTLKKLGEKLGGKFLNKIKPKHDIPHNPFLSVSGLSFQTTNFTLVLDFQHLDQFSTNISTDIALSNYLVKNLTLTNSIFHQFVENELLDVLYYMARTNISSELEKYGS